MKARRVVTKQRGVTVVDRGAQGQAMLRRPAALEVIEGDVTAEDGSTTFERAQVVRYADSMLEHYARAGVLTGRRFDAALHLAETYSRARSPSRVAGAYSHRFGGYGEMSDEQDMAWSEYCRLVDHIPKGCQAACIDVARGQFPTGVAAVRHLEDGFKALADHLKIGADDGLRPPKR